MAELVSIPISYFELVVDYKEPNVRLWVDRATVVQGLFNAFKPWDLNVDDVEVLTQGKLSEQGVKFKLPAKGISFFFGPASCKFTRDDANWDALEETIQILDAAISTLLNLGKAEKGSQKSMIALHLQLKTVPFREILKPFVPAQIAAIEAGSIMTAASVVKWDKRKITIDGSGVVANAIFLRFEREFEGNATYDDMAHRLKADEESLFEILGIEEDRA